MTNQQFPGIDFYNNLIMVGDSAGQANPLVLEGIRYAIKFGRVAGIVVNWMPVSALPRNITCVDPIALEAKIIIDSSGHDSVAVKRLVDRGLVEWKGMNPMYVNEGEEHVVEKTGEVYPGLIAAGMSVTETHGLARMGPTFGSMLFSGKKAAQIAAEKIKELER
jgi:ribulose 1,5-bisphosphate synthetase/thiazole synthase